MRLVRRIDRDGRPFHEAMLANHTRRRLFTLLNLGLVVAFCALPALARSRRPMPTPIVPEPDLREVQRADASAVKRLNAVAHRPWLSGTSIALLPGDKRVAIADADNHLVVIAAVDTGIVEHRIGAGRRPERLVVAPNGTVFVVSRGSRSVSAIDPIRGVELRSADAGVEPYGIALSPDGSTLLVTASASGELFAFDATTLSVRFRLSLESPWPAAVAFHPDGKRAYVTHLQGGTVDIVDLERQRVTGTLQLPKRGTGMSGGSTGFDVERTPNHAVAATVSPGGKRLFVAHTMINTGAATAGFGSGGYGLGSPLPIVATVAAFDLESGKLLRSPVQGQGFDPSDLAPQGIVAPTPNPSFAEDQQVQQLAQPMALVHDPKLARLFMVAMGSDRVMTLDSAVADPIGRPQQVVAVGHAPRGVAVTADGRRAFVHNAQGFSVSVLDLSRPAMSEVGKYDIAADSSFTIGKDPLPPEVALGRRLFTYALDTRVGGPSRFACASCHPDGRQDGLVWHVGIGPRQTPVLADRLDATGPFNWIGSEEKLEENVKSTIARLGGTGLDEKEREVLANYVTHYLPPIDNPHRTSADHAEVAMGRDLFHDAQVGCSGCHDSGRKFMDGVRHDVGTTTALEVNLWTRVHGAGSPGGPRETPVPQAQQVQLELDGIDMEQQGLNRIAAPMGANEPPQPPPVAYDTPALRHLWASGPYYHDGSSETLEALLTTGNPGDRMGKTSHLSKKEIRALATYLKTL